MTSIYDRLLEIDQSGKYYVYYPEHVVNMDCFHDLEKTIDRLGKRPEYIDLYLKYFKQEMASVLREKHGKLRPTLDDHIFCHLNIDSAFYEEACFSLPMNSSALLYKALVYLSEATPGIYHNLDKNTVNAEVSDYIRGPYLKFENSYILMRLFNALEILSEEDQLTFFVAGVAHDLSKESLFSSFAEMILQPGNLSHGEIVLMARSALECYDDVSMELCRKFFRETDAETDSDFKMNV